MTSDATSAHAAPCRVWLLGTLEVELGPQRLQRLPSRAVAALLARLSLYPQRLHPREELIELLWPGVELDAGRNRLRQALSVLRGLLQTPASGQIIEADRVGVRVVAGALDCDVVRFEALARAGRSAEALALYRGELMPGHYDDWIAHERMRLSALAESLGDTAGVLPMGTAAGPAPPTAAAPGLSPARSAQPALPRYLTRLLGADQTCADLGAVVAASRLVTLLGPGGTGKTRLAVETATRLRDAGDGRFDLVAFVPLVACSGSADLLDAMLLALRQSLRSADVVAQLAGLLAERRVLLVLDNAEQLVEAAAPLVARLLESTDRLHLLVTSRRALGLDGEVHWRMPSLPVPAPDADAESAAACASVALFVDRARAARADFHLGARTTTAVVELVRLLEGMPLAIELAAARVRSLPPAALVQRLREAQARPDGAALELLARSGPRGGSDPRHASMLKVIDWSWQLLPETARTLLAATSVCSGGFSLAAAQALSGVEAAATLNVIDILVDHSLLRAEEVDGEPRWWPYELIREYAHQQLAPAAARRARSRHADWLQRWAEALPLNASLPQVRAELPNLALAMSEALAQGRPEQACRLLLALQPAVSDMVLPLGMLQTLEQAVSALPRSELQALSHVALMRAWHRVGDQPATDRHADAAMAQLPAAGLARAQVLARVSHVRWRRFRDATVEPQLHEALDLARGAGALSLQASILTTLGALARKAGRRADAVALQQQALAAWTEAGDAAGCLTGMGNLVLALAEDPQRREEARLLARRMLDGTRAAQDWGRHASGCINLGEVLCGQRRWAEAAQAYREALALGWRTLDMLPLAYALWNLPHALAHQRRPRDALQLAAFAGRFWHQHVAPLNASDLRDLARVRRLARVQLTAARARQHWAEGEALGLADAVQLALRETPSD
ncbi:MAG: ATP-binding protein [Aquabacterium sp.]